MAFKCMEVTGRWITRYPRAVVSLFALLAAASLLVTLTRLEFRTDQNDLVGRDLEFNRRYLEFLGEFGDLEFLYIVLRVGEDPERAMAAADAVQREVSALSRPDASEGGPLVQWVLHRIEPEALRFGLLHCDPGELDEVARWIESHRDDLGSITSVTGFASLLRYFVRSLSPERMAEEVRGGGESGAGAAAGPPAGAEWMMRILSLAIDTLRRSLRGEKVDGFRLALDRAMGRSARQRGYLATGNGRLLLVEVLAVKDPESTELIREPLRAIRRVLEGVRRQFPDVEIGLTGRPVLQADEMRTTNHDMRIATALAFLSVLLLFVLFFRRLRRPTLAVITLSVAILLTFGVVSVTIGHLTLLSIVFAAMLVGLGIDFGIHFIARYQEELSRGASVDEAIVSTLRTTGSSISTGAVTTAAAFYTILLVDFQGLRELGFIAGTGVLLCLVSMLTLLPALLCLSDRWVAARRAFHPPRPIRVPLLPLAARGPAVTLTLVVLVTGVGLFSVRGIPYDSNLINLQAEGLDSVKYEKMLIRESEFSTWYCAFVVRRQEDLAALRERLRPAQEQGVVGQTECLLDYVPADQSEKLPYLARAWSVVKEIEWPRPSAQFDAPSTRAALEDLLDSLDDLSSMALRRQEAEAAAELDRLAGEVEGCLEEASEIPSERLAALGSLQKAWFGGMLSFLSAARDALEPRPLRARDLPFILRHRLISTDGKRFLLYANPGHDIWEEEPMREFVAAARRIDPDVTGTPIQVYESSRLMREGFLLAALYSLGVTLLFLFIDLRRLADALLAMLPLLFGLLWLLELLPLLGLEFNLANFFSLPILIGCGIDGGVHILHRWRESRNVAEVCRTTGSAVTLSFLTTLVGFGAMGIAHHRGVASLGAMMSTGLIALLVASVVVLPAVLAAIERWGPAWRRRP